LWIIVLEDENLVRHSPCDESNPTLGD